MYRRRARDHRSKFQNIKDTIHIATFPKGNIFKPEIPKMAMFKSNASNLMSNQGSLIKGKTS